ncbi:hypothetical protein BJV74DRAFT_285849 [Russula compacta]|nr:hypothetical protein BJV74DRAFT_285849 [Russula compacta]
MCNDPCPQPQARGLASYCLALPDHRSPSASDSDLVAPPGLAFAPLGKMLLQQLVPAAPP